MHRVGPLFTPGHGWHGLVPHLWAEAAILVQESGFWPHSSSDLRAAVSCQPRALPGGHGSHVDAAASWFCVYSSLYFCVPCGGQVKLLGGASHLSREHLWGGYPCPRCLKVRFQCELGLPRWLTAHSIIWVLGLGTPVFGSLSNLVSIRSPCLCRGRFDCRSVERLRRPSCRLPSVNMCL